MDNFYRSPILITGKKDFTFENGVKNPWASGIKEDPYIIKDWIIDALGGEYGILIQDSNVYFRIENCTVYNSGNTIDVDSNVKFDNVTNGQISWNNLSNSGSGIYSILLINSHDNIIDHNNATNNNNIGIVLISSNNNTIIYNNASNNGYHGIYSKYSDFNNFSSNYFQFNTLDGFLIEWSCDNNTIFNNTINNNTGNGIRIKYRASSSNQFNNFSKNYVSNNQGTGIKLESSGNGNLIYTNYIVGNNIQAEDNGINNQWDNGTIGNYWGDYESNYPNAWNDGFFWDTPYSILGSANSFDNHPIDNFLEDDPFYSNFIKTQMMYSKNGVYEFNCTWTDDDNAISEVFLRFNDTIYSVSQNFSGEFSYIFYDLPANENGYEYQWLAKDQYNAWNATPINSFILYRSNILPLSLLFNGTEGNAIHYSHQDVNITILNQTVFSGNFELYINNVLVDQIISSYLTNISRYSIIGLYNVTGIVNNQNYSGSITYWMTIEDIIAPDIIFDISPFYLNTTTPQYYQTELQINCTAQDDTSIIWVYLSENSTGTFVNHTMSYVNGNYTFNLDISSLNWGNTIMFSFYAKDSAGNIKWDNNGGLNYSIQIYDFQDPITVLDFQIVESPNFISNSTLFTLSTDDDILNGSSGIYNISYRIDSGGWILYTNPFNLAGHSHGIHTIYYYATDNAGNTEVINQEIVFLDIQSPNIIFDISPSYLNTTTPQYQQTGLQINCTVQDDTSIIWVLLSENSTGIFVNRTMLYVNGNYTFNLDISSLNWGNTIMFSFYAKDSAGNIKWDNNGGLNYSIIIYDFQDPTTTLDFQNVESPNFVSNLTLFTFNSDDWDIDASGIYNISYRIDSGSWILYTNPFSLTGYSHGIHTIYYYATDNAGNTEVINQEIVFLDIQSPNIIFDISPSYLNTTTPQYQQTGLQINCTVQDDTSIIWVLLSENSTGIFVNRTMLYVNGNYTFNLDISSLNWGNTIMFSFYAKDSAGNIKWDNNGGLNYSIIIYDFHDPITTLDFDLSFNPNFVTIYTLFSLFAEDRINIGGSGVQTISYKIDSGGWNIYSVPFKLSDYSESIHTIYYNTTDYAGNSETTKQLTIYLDKNNISTLISFTCYENSNITYVNNVTQFTINWSDGTGSGLRDIYFKVDSGNYSVWSTPFTLQGFSEGFHNITFYSIDNVGNEEPDKKIQVYLDITIIEIEISFDIIHAPNYIDEHTEMSITFLEDLGSSVKHIQYRIGNGTWNNGTNFYLTGLDLGEKIIYYRVEDHVGNFREKSKIIFLVTDNSDLDEDGLIYSEELENNTEPFNDDTDNDKLTDGEEVNIYHTNPLSQDTDGDGYSDYDEIFKYRTEPNNALSSLNMIIFIAISVLSIISTSGYISVKKWKKIHRRRVENEIFTRISEDKIKVLDFNTLNTRLQKVKSKLDFDDIKKTSNVNGQYILNGALFVKDIGIEEFAILIREIVKKINVQNLSNREDVNLIKINVKDLEQDKRVLELIEKLKG